MTEFCKLIQLTFDSQNCNKTLKNNDMFVVEHYPKIAIESDERESEVTDQITSKTIV